MKALIQRLWNHLFRIHVRFMAVGLLLVAVPLAGISFARFYEREMLRALEEDMIHQAEVLRQTLRADPSGLRLEERKALLRDISKDTRTRIRLLSNQGLVLADSDASARFPETDADADHPYWGMRRTNAFASTVALHQRVEIRRAMKGRYGSHMRFGKNANLLFLCSALPIVSDGKVQGIVYVTRSTGPVWAAMHRLRRSLFKVLLVSALGAILISLFLAATISRPLSRLTRVAQAIARGDRSHRLELDGRDEIGQLARAFDAMTHKLDERARYIAELTANISHEFKSPLTSIRGAAELLLEGAADDPAARTRFLQNMLADSQRLDRLVTRLLELSRVESDPAPDEEFDLGVLVEEVVGQRSTADIRATSTLTRPRIRGRRAHLASVLGNLLDNAVQHAAAGTTVDVKLEDGPRGSLAISVHNDGAPISPANLPKIWDRFFSTRADRGGTGLGLPIVATVVRAHGGSVDVASTQEAGTTFTVTLPEHVRV